MTTITTATGKTYKGTWNGKTYNGTIYLNRPVGGSIKIQNPGEAEFETFRKSFTFHAAEVKISDGKPAPKSTAAWMNMMERSEA